MSKKSHIILIPVYNDEQSLNKLLLIINEHIDGLVNFNTEILILNDASTDEILLENKKLRNFKKVSMLEVKKNIGSQKIITVGLKYLQQKRKSFFVTILDSDGEDNPLEIRKMLNLASENNDYVITSNRKGRKESFLIKSLYFTHLILTFFFSFKWISFGNFTSFHSKNIEKILSYNDSWLAYSGSVIKNCKIKRLHAKRERRFYGSSKIGILKLIEHSLRINLVFLKKVLFLVPFYIFFIYIIFGLNQVVLLIIFLLLIFKLALLITKINHLGRNLENFDELIKSYKSI